MYGEIDFLVLAPKLGVFALEVKGDVFAEKMEYGISRIDTEKITKEYDSLD
jgi:hypothetical protein